MFWQLFPFFHSSIHRFQYCFGAETIDGREALAVGRANVNTLARFPRFVSARVPRVGHALKEQTIVILKVVQSPYFVRGRHKLLGKLDNTFVRPYGPPAFYTVVSRTAEGVAVHRPEQYWFVFGGCFSNSTFQVRLPVDRRPCQF